MPDTDKKGPLSLFCQGRFNAASLATCWRNGGKPVKRRIVKMKGNYMQLIETNGATRNILFPTAKRANERETLKVMTFREFAKIRGITKSTPKAEVKAAMEEHRQEKVRVMKLITAAGAMLMSSSDFTGKKVQTWTDSKGVRRAQVTVEEVDTTAVDPDTKAKVIETLSIEEMKAAIAAKEEEAKKASAIEA